MKEKKTMEETARLVVVNVAVALVATAKRDLQKRIETGHRSLRKIPRVPSQRMIPTPRMYPSSSLIMP